MGLDAALVGREDFRARIGRGKAPVKARLLDQGAISGVGNLLADEALWRARLAPQRVTGELSTEELDRLRRAVRAATRDAIRDGGVHTGTSARGDVPVCTPPLRITSPVAARTAPRRRSGSSVESSPVALGRGAARATAPRRRAGSDARVAPWSSRRAFNRRLAAADARPEDLRARRGRRPGPLCEVGVQQRPAEAPPVPQREKRPSSNSA